ncbi:MAG: DUF692 domain-containing protein [Bacteroidota bacterium]|nr:DUF692 domain-containing protein [Bacteroidota bacterium]
MKNIPFLGTGIGFRPELKSFIFLNRDKIDFLEIIADHYIDVPESKWEELSFLKKHFTLIPHAINLSLGSADGINEAYLEKLIRVIDFIQPPYWSEHISYTQSHGYDIGHLSPVIFSNEFLAVLEKNILYVKSKTSCPLILENITYHIEFAGREYNDAAFLNTLCEKTGCGLLLDITNAFINSKNLGFDPLAFIDELNAETITQLHYVGYEDSPSQVIDTHARQTQPEIFALMEHVLKRHTPKGILLERDDRFELADELIADLTRAKEILQKASAC